MSEYTDEKWTGGLIYYSLAYPTTEEEKARRQAERIAKWGKRRVDAPGIFRQLPIWREECC